MELALSSFLALYIPISGKTRKCEWEVAQWVERVTLLDMAGGSNPPFPRRLFARLCDHLKWSEQDWILKFQWIDEFHVLIYRRPFGGGSLVGRVCPTHESTPPPEDAKRNRRYVVGLDF